MPDAHTGKARTKLEIHQEQTIKAQTSEIARLRKALRIFLADVQSSGDEEESSSGSDATTRDSDSSGDEEGSSSNSDATTRDSEEQEGSDDSDSLPTPIYIILNERWHDDYTPRCVECHGEVVEGTCWYCEKEHEWDPTLYHVSHSTESQAISTDRSRVQRSTTPLLGMSEIKLTQPPNAYLQRWDEYTQLLRRGATRLMCETFNLEFTEEGGIFAWADQELYEEFAGPLMQHGDFWKIHLGRLIELDEDDLDGGRFLEELLEEALYFLAHWARWETVEETPGIWVTRLVKKRKVDTLEELMRDSEESEEDEEEEEESDGEFVDEQARLNDIQPGPIRDINEYDMGDDDVEEDYQDEACDMALDDPGWATRANVRDSGWPSDSEMDEDYKEDNDGTLADVNVKQEAAATDLGFIHSDCDSDFDSDLD